MLHFRKCCELPSYLVTRLIVCCTYAGPHAEFPQFQSIKYSRAVHNELKNDIIIGRETQTKSKRKIYHMIAGFWSHHEYEKIRMQLMTWGRLSSTSTAINGRNSYTFQNTTHGYDYGNRNLVSQYICVWKKSAFSVFRFGLNWLLWLWRFFTCFFFVALRFAYSFARALSAVRSIFPFFVANIPYHYVGYTHSNA